MDYTIVKIEISEEEGSLLLAKMERAVRNHSHYELDKRAVEFEFNSEDGKITIWMKVEFFSDYRSVDGGIETVSRSVMCNMKMTEAAGGSQIEFECPVAFEEELQTILSI